ncbi:unnamed protein product [Orchesella dallaii]|uniref:Uncharacterized protein n=1 Tax=Orchesella dallaii TaxID=48710 RepID=A0ABP1S850_9HEXA
MGSCLSSNNSLSARPIANYFYTVLDVLRDVVIDMSRIENDLRKAGNRNSSEENFSSALQPILQEFGHSFIDLTYVFWELESVVSDMSRYTSEFEHEFNILFEICHGLEIIFKGFINLLKKLLQKIDDPNSPVAKLIHSTLSELAYFIGSN